MVVRMIDLDTPSEVYYLSKGDLGPLEQNNTEIKVWLRSIW